MFYATAAPTAARDAGLPHDPFKAIVAPRPIGWISACSAAGAVNLSPYSFFNAVSDRPPMVVFSSDGRKDAVTFIEETGEFVCSLATFALREAMNRTSAPLPRGESEFGFAGLTPAPSKLVKPPRVAESPCALECVLTQVLPLPGRAGTGRWVMVIGEVVGIHIDDRVLVDGRLDPVAMGTIARAGYRDYFVAQAASRFEMTRPPGGD